MKKKYVITFGRSQEVIDAVKSYGWKQIQKHPHYSKMIVTREFSDLKERKAYLLALKDMGNYLMYTLYRK